MKKKGFLSRVLTGKKSSSSTPSNASSSNGKAPSTPLSRPINPETVQQENYSTSQSNSSPSMTASPSPQSAHPPLLPQKPLPTRSSDSDTPFPPPAAPMVMSSMDDTGSIDENYNSTDSFNQENYKYPVIKNDSALREIGDRIRAIQHEIQTIEDSRIRDYNRNDLPQIKATIKLLQKEIEMLKNRALIEKDEGPSHLENLSAEISKNESKIVDLQSRMHFPFANFVMGSDGLFGSCNDLWVENISGRVEISVIHTGMQSAEHATASKLSLRLHGPNGPNEGGLTMKLKVTDFKLKSEIATIPSVSFQELKWDVVVRIRAMLTYALKRTEKTSRMGHWVCPSTDFDLEIVTITAPISLDSRLVSALLKPQLLKIVLSLLPRELGDILTPFGGHHTECALLGNFSLIGTKMDLMARKMVFSKEVCQLVSCSPTQLAVFRFMQKSVNTPSRIKTMDDLLAYIVKFRDTERWNELLNLWQQAIDIYTAKLTTFPLSAMSHPIPSAMSFQNLLDGAEVLLKKPVQLCIQLSQIHCQVSMRKILAAYYSWKDHRVEKAAQKLMKKGLMKSSSAEEYCNQSHIRRRREHHERTALLTIFATFLSTLSTETNFRLHTGDDISLGFERISATLPVVHLANFPVNPFSTTLPLFLNFLLKKFQPTATESVIVSMTDENTLDVKVISTLHSIPENDLQSEEEESSVEKNRPFKTPNKSVGEKLKSFTQNSPLNNYLSEASSKAGSLLSHFQSPGSNISKKESPQNTRLKRRGSFDEGSNADHPPLLHVILSGMNSGLALSNEWGRNADTGTIRPGQTIFSVQIDESFRPNQLTLDNHVTAAYRMIAQCETRPLIRKLVQKLPELKNGASNDTLRTTVGGWPVCMKVNEHFRVGVDIKCVSCTLNLISTLDCIDGYVNNPSAIASVMEISEETLLNLSDSLKRLDKYLSREGVDVDTHLSYHFETVSIQNPLLRKRYGGAEEDVILTISSTATKETTGPVSTPEASSKGRRRSLTAFQPLSMEGNHALKLRLDLDIWDVVEDMMAISQFVIQAATEPST